MFSAEIFRGFDDDGDDVGTTVAIGTERNAVAAEFERGTGLGTGGDLHGDFTVDGFDINFCAKSCVDHIDVLFGKNDGAFASKMFVGFDFDADIEVAWFGSAFRSGATFTAEFDRHAIVDTGGDFDF